MQAGLWERSKSAERKHIQRELPHEGVRQLEDEIALASRMLQFDFDIV